MAGFLSGLSERLQTNRPRLLAGLRNNSNALLGLAGGVAGGQGPKAIGQGLQGFLSGGQIDRQAAQDQVAEEERQRLQALEAQRQQSLAFALDEAGITGGQRGLYESYPEAGVPALLDYYTPDAPDYGFMDVDGNVIRTDSTAGTAEPLWSAPDDPTDADLPADWQLYQLSRQQYIDAGLEPPTYDAWDLERKGREGGIDPGASGTPFGDALGGGLADQLLEMRETANDAVVSLQSAQESRALLDSGVIVGAGANFITGFASWLRQAGWDIAGDDLDNTQAFIATRAADVGRIIKLFGAGTGLSDADRRYAEMAAAGNITLNEAAIRRILDINERASRYAIEQYNELARQIPADISPFPLTIDLPPGFEGAGPQLGADNDPLGIR